MKNVFVTGAAGFIGFHLSKRLLAQNYKVIGIDNLNSYYDVTLKQARLSILENNRNFSFFKVDIADRQVMANFFREHRPDIVVNLAAQAGVRYSIDNPYAYLDSNLSGFINILEGCRHNEVKHLIFASSSSVYGANSRTPYSVHDNVDHPLSLYAATKKSNELMAHCYSSLYRLPCTGLRFFTVFGPWGRPDMAYFLFTKAILENKPINVFNNGNMMRDITYIDDIVEALMRLLEKIPTPDPAWQGDIPDPSISFAPYRIYNVGNNNPISLMDLIETLEKYLGCEAIKNFLPMQAGDVLVTCADIADLMASIDFRPQISFTEGIQFFVDWYRSYFNC